MKIAGSIIISVKQLSGHKMRTVLALIGIIIGVSAVIIVVSIGMGAQREVLSKIDDMGTNLIIVNAGVPITRGGMTFFPRPPSTLTIKDGESLFMQISKIEQFSPYQSRSFNVKYQNASVYVTVAGTSPEFAEITNYKIASGDYFAHFEDESFARVAVLGYRVKDALFEHLDPVGETVYIGNQPFRVIGWLEEKGSDVSGSDQDNFVFIPINTGLRRVFNQNYLRSIYLQLSSFDRLDDTVNEISEILRHNHNLVRFDRDDDFTIITQEDIIEAYKETADSFTALITGIAGISLLIGGVGVLSIMLIAIRERSREIGLRMSVGARRSDIMLQFIIEASILGTAGGLLGIAIGMVVSYGLILFADWTLAISVPSIVISFFFSFIVGMFFGVYPAYKASLLNPITALRSE